MRNALIVAHGFPSDPIPADRKLQDLAAQVNALLPDWQIGAATLACPGALRAALVAQPQAPVYPFFMAEGWFTRVQLPRRLAELGHAAPILPPFGRDPALPELVAKAISAAGCTEVILVAHGSEAARSSRETTEALARQLAEILPHHRLVLAFLEEEPHLRLIASHHRDAVCLPLFALRAGHVALDIPKSLAEAGHRGPLLPAIGETAGVPALIAAALARG
ncbi:sirohydrochlorin chelatase [Rhodobacter maris]|uniref:Sirohydrochlorin ferrochelatase n=1 Tax=Rhodobacter maris TaxID=446682 RepID=A0A285SGR2_9RHOB|nr:CbiX/SirB N-terminal domain-containing protein [Rhodobacter maris]SOC06789.1 sirohydrochlorin ferrochelatase [Rhodobacter maris]